MRCLYNILLHAALVAGFPLILPIILCTSKWRKSFPHRAGLFSPRNEATSASGPSSQPVWIHALSVGEVISAAPLVTALSDSMARPLVFSSTTQSGYQIADTLLSDTVETLFYFPYDLPFSINRVANDIHPALVIIVETDIWPNFLFGMARRRVPVILVNARLSDRSFSWYRRFSPVMKPVFDSFTLICAQAPADADRFRRLGVSSHKIVQTGNLKFDQSRMMDRDFELGPLKSQLKLETGRKVVIAGSTHAGEESILLDAFCRLREKDPKLLIIAAPRHPARAVSICQDFSAAGFTSVLMKDVEAFSTQNIETEIQVLVVDVLGVLKALYALADVAFVGGSLVNGGGHNPLEPAAFAKPVIFGPDMSDFKHISTLLLECGGAIRVQDAESFYHAALSFLEDERKASEAGRRAHSLLSANKGAIEKTIAAVHGMIH